jgi:hypothetical protein
MKKRSMRRRKTRRNRQRGGSFGKLTAKKAGIAEQDMWVDKFNKRMKRQKKPRTPSTALEKFSFVSEGHTPPDGYIVKRLLINGDPYRTQKWIQCLGTATEGELSEWKEVSGDLRRYFYSDGTYVKISTDERLETSPYDFILF